MSGSRTPSEDAVSLLAPAGALLAAALPYVAFSLASPDALRDVKILGQALGGAAVLAGLALTQAGAPASSSPGLPARAARWGAAILWLLVAASSVRSIPGGLDPLDAVTALAPAALFLWGAAPGGAEVAGRLLGLVIAAGAGTGALAALQRFGGLLRLPVEAPEPRFLASALIGNPGDVAASLVLPALLLWDRLDQWGRRPARERMTLALAGAGILGGLAAAATATPVVALGAGLAVHALAAPRRRLPRLAVIGTLALAALATSDTGRRLAEKAFQATQGDVGETLTQRDIGYLAAAEIVRARPLLGSGPGGYSRAFVPARIAAEERGHRRLVHTSSSSHFENAHCDPLTLAAECGVPAAAAATLVLLALAAGLVREARRGDAPQGEGPSPSTLVALLAGLLVLSLASFPARIPSVAGPAAFLVGLAWRRVGATGALRVGPPLRRAVLMGAAVVLVLGAGVRFAATYLQALGEQAAGAVSMAPPGLREGLVARAFGNLSRAVALRPRKATARLDLGVAHGMAGRLPEAIGSMEASLRLEERAETVLDLGRIHGARGETAKAAVLYTRAVWTMPKLVKAIPDPAEAQAVKARVDRLAIELQHGGRAPELPDELRRPWP